jgi:hypothetical protein
MVENEAGNSSTGGAGSWYRPTATGEEQGRKS